MKKSGILLGSEVTVKVPYQGTADQIRGIITEVDSTTITVTEKLDEKAEEAGKVARVVKVPKASAEVLAFHKNPNVPEAVVEDGVLTVNGEAVRTGFEVLEVLITLANRVYVTAAVEDTDRVDVYSYNVAKDEFYKVTNKALALDTDTLTEIGTSVIVPYLNKYEDEEDVTKDDGSIEKVPYEVLEETGYLIISTNSTFAAIIKTELGNSPIIDARTLGDSSAFFVTTSTIKTKGAPSLDNGIDDYDDDDYDDDYDDDDDDDYYDSRTCAATNTGRIVPLEDGKIIIRVYKVQGRHLTSIGAVELDGEYVSAVIAGRTAVIKTTKTIHVNVAGRIYEINDKIALKELDGFDFVVKNELKNGVLKIWFSNKNAELKVYSVTPAEDARGPIIEVQ